MGYVPRPGDNPDKYRDGPGLSVPIFKKAVAISLLGHLAVFGFFNLSFGVKIPAANYSRVSFWGAAFRKSDFTAIATGRMNPAEKTGFNKISIRNRSVENILIASPSLKPQAALGLETGKVALVQKTSPLLPPSRKTDKKEIMFYPSLPYHFILYFKGRQVAHIELMFNILSKGGNKATILLRRKVSSGNLEADLLSMRYINHYLFIQHAAFTPNNWQAVKIELSAKND